VLKSTAQIADLALTPNVDSEMFLKCEDYGGNMQKGDRQISDKSSLSPFSFLQGKGVPEIGQNKKVPLLSRDPFFHYHFYII
jgi:hypothetical protein